MIQTSMTDVPMVSENVPFELVSLSKAVNYQKWVFRLVEPYIGRRTLELGAGIGNMSKWLPVRERLILSENDPRLIATLNESMGPHAHDARVSTMKLDLASSDADALVRENLDTIVSFNVLEHIEDDRTCLERLADLLRKSSAQGPRRLITFVPAHQWAYGTMDREFGHFRRYSKRAVQKLCRDVAPEAKLTIRHFNIVGLAGWILNGRILQKASIGTDAIETFERLVPWISPVDDFVHGALRLPMGQSILVVLEWQP